MRWGARTIAQYRSSSPSFGPPCSPTTINTTDRFSLRLLNSYLVLAPDSKVEVTDQEHFLTLPFLE